MTKRRYQIRRQNGNQDYDWFDAVERCSIDVLEHDRRPVDTGLLDPYGNKIFRQDPREPIGFKIARML